MGEDLALVLATCTILITRAIVVGLTLILEIGYHELVRLLADQMNLGEQLVDFLDRITLVTVGGVILFTSAHTLYTIGDLFISDIRRPSMDKE
jgi:high-affinity nickel permease